MKITFIRPNMVHGRSSDAMPPLAFAALSAHTSQDVEKEFYDECIEEIPLDMDTDLVAISAHTFSARRAYEIADSYKGRGIPVVMGGYHPSFMPEEALGHADSVVIGPAEGQWERLVSDAKAHRLSRIYDSREPAAMSSVHYDVGIFDGKKYTPVFPVEFTRGCRFECEFCSVSAFNKYTYTVRPLEAVVHDIRRSDAKRILIVDDNVLSNRSEAKKLFEALIPLKIQWGCQISIDVARDTDMLKLMARSGCVLCLIGFESLRKENLVQMRKGSHITGKEYAAAIGRIRDHGIMIYASFVFGYDFDTDDIFDQTLEFALKHKFVLANFNTLNPMPGTGLYDRLKSEGRLIDERWWLHERFKYGEVMFIPKHLTPEQLKQGCMRVRFEFSTVSAIVRRALDFKANCNSIGNLSLFLLANAVARKEIRTKMKRLQ